ncbi:MAG TPA: hypothetical protein VK817_18045 [Trebonia sp.]|jgi:hypothetical protein|nr:hypothetical protein [Trebonia sp.]
MPKSEAQRWRAPAILQVKSAVSAAIGILVVAVFFPLWIAVPVSVALGVWGIGMCVRRPAVLLDADAGRLTIRLGPITRRVSLDQVNAIALDRGKVTIGKADGTAISCYAWRKGTLDRWLKVPDIASDLAHAISKAAAAARPADQTGAASVRSGKHLPLIAVMAAGAAEIAAVFFVRVSWGSPVMTALGMLVALAFGFAGVISLLVALWTFLASARRENSVA